MSEQSPERVGADEPVATSTPTGDVPDIESVLQSGPTQGPRVTEPAVGSDADPEDIESVLTDGGREPHITTEPYDPSRAREWMRGAIVAALVLLLAFLVVGPLWAIWAGKPYADMQGFLTLVFGSLSALVGSAVGFYFGERRQ